MKKFTLLFALVVAMSGNILGQNLPKVLWEDTSVPFKYEYASTNTMRVSPLGNILVVSTNFNKTQNAKVFDKNGKLLWVDSDYFNKPDARFYVDIENPSYMLIRCERGTNTDSLLYFDKNYKFLKGFEISKLSGNYYTSLVDGIVYQDSKKSLLKYDINGKEEWTYKTDSLITIITDKSPYVGIINKSTVLSDKKSLIILDKNGLKKGQTAPELFNATKISPTNDNGFWATTPNSYLKFDSTGKKTATFNTADLTLIDKTKESRQLIAPDNSLIFVYLNTKKELCFTKINPRGNISNIVKKLGTESDENLKIHNVKISQEGAVMYAISYSNLIISGGGYSDFLFLGAEKFEDDSFSWYKRDVSYFDGNYYSLDENDKINDAFNIFYRVGVQTDSLKLERYALNGKLLWPSIVVPSKPTINSINDRIYISCTSTEYWTDKKSSTYQLDAKTGKILWKIENEILPTKNSRSVPVKSISMDNDGNTIMIYYTPPGGYSGGYLDKVRFIGKNGNTFGLFAYPGLSLYTDPSITKFGCWALGENNSFVSYTYNAGDYDRGSKYYFQKISPCNYNFSTPVGAVTGTEKISGLTEACPTEKIKISAAKYDGAVYEWQKDGKILPALKASEHEMGESGTYKLTIKDTVCLYSGVSNELKINIRSLPITGISTTKSIFCEGEKTTISAQTNGAIFQWQKDEKDIPNATKTTFEASLSGNYRVGVRGDKCPQVGYSNLVTINTKPLPEAMISTDVKGVVYASSIKLSANTGAGLSYQWLKNDSLLANETTAIYETKISGKYAVKVTKDGCIKTSEPLLISILVPLANSEEVGEETVQVYPNPSNGNFKIILPKSLKDSDIQLLDSFGRLRSLIYTGEQAQAEGLVQGVYFLKISKNGKVVTSKLVIE